MVFEHFFKWSKSPGNVAIQLPNVIDSSFFTTFLFRISLEINFDQKIGTA